MANHRKVIVNLATSADGYIARPDGDIEWLTSRPKPADFYGIGAFMKSVDTMLLGRKTYDESRRLGAKFDTRSGRYVVFSRQPAPPDVPANVEWVRDDVGAFMGRLREQPGKDIWLMGGGDLIASLLDENMVDEIIVRMVPVLIGDGIPLIARRHREVPLELRNVERFDDGVVGLHYHVGSRGGATLPARATTR